MVLTSKVPKMAEESHALLIPIPFLHPPKYLGWLVGMFSQFFASVVVVVNSKLGGKL